MATAKRRNHQERQADPDLLSAHNRCGIAGLPYKLNSQFAPEKLAEISSEMPKVLNVGEIHPKRPIPLLFSSGN
jgi:hypothetical protein